MSGETAETPGDDLVPEDAESVDIETAVVRSVHESGGSDRLSVYAEELETIGLSHGDDAFVVTTEDMIAIFPDDDSEGDNE